MSAPRACGCSRRAERTDAHLELSLLLPLTSTCQSARLTRVDTTPTRAPLRREQVFVRGRAAGFAARAPIYFRASRVWPQPPRRARRCPPRAQPAAAPHNNAPSHSKPRRRPRERRRGTSESRFLIVSPASPRMHRSMSAPRACGRSCRAEHADAPLELRLLLLLKSPRQIN